jgi:hypothetical protein
MIIVTCIGCNTKKVTFVEVAPIIYKNCSNCHRPNQSGPFSLLNYSDCRSKAATIKFTVETRFMPPWPADYTYTHFIGEKYLTDNEISLICQWVDDGALMGDSNLFPSPPDFYPGSMLGKPDLVVKATPFFIRGDKHERFIMMKIPFENKADTFIKAIEFVTNNKKLVHHVNGHLLNYLPYQLSNLHKPPFVIDRDTAYEIAESFHNLNLYGNDNSEPSFTGSVTNYLPGMETMLLPEGIGTYKVNKYAALLLRDIHYGATTADTWDSSYFNIFYAAKAPTRPTIERQLGTLGISPIVPPLVIQPNRIDTFRTQATLPFDISLITINPHMHLIGKSFWAYAVKSDGDTIPLIRIKKWDFRWQYYYTFKHMLKIPKNATIYVEGVYDNTADNPNNPFYPPQVIREPIGGNMKTTDEMFQLIITYVPYQNGDEKISLQPK